MDSASRVAQLVRTGVLSKPERESRPHAEDIERVQASESVSSLVAEQRRLDVDVDLGLGLGLGLD